MHKIDPVPKDDIVGRVAKPQFSIQETLLNQKSYPQLSGKLFIGLTTKPCYELQSRSETTQLS